jgi:hypothetical protein
MTQADYHIRHMKRLKTEISSKLSKNLTDEGKQINQTVGYYFNKNDKGQIGEILK